MTLLVTCPKADTWEQFLLGRTAEESAPPFEEHLNLCAACQQMIAKLPASDEFVGALADSSRMSFDDTNRRAVSPELIDVLVPHLKRIRGPLQPATDPGLRSDESTISIRYQAPSQPADTTNHPPHQLNLGPYEVRGTLGSGGMGTVYEAFDPRLQRSIAIKVVQARLCLEPNWIERFLREARAAAAVEHDHIVAIYAVETHDGIPCLVMPLLRGQSLKDRLTAAGGPLPLAEILRIGCEVASGLAAAHDRGMVHRDIKPANLWLEEKTGRVKILDFGLATMRSEASPDDAEISGTPGFFAPEQARGLSVDARSDLFSLGCVLYLMATGKLPYQGPSSLRSLWTVIGELPTPASKVNPKLPVELSDLITCLLQRQPADRPATALEVHKALAALARRPAEQLQRLTRRRWLMGIACATLLSGTSVALWAWATMTNDLPPVEVTFVSDPVDLKLVLRRDGEDQTVNLAEAKSLQLTPGEYQTRLAVADAKRSVYPERFVVLADKPQTIHLSLVGEVASHSTHSQPVTGVAVSVGTERTTIYSVGLDRVLVAWNPQDVGEPKFIELAHAGRCVAVSSNGLEVATGGGNKSPPTELTINRWKTSTLEEIDYPLVDHTRMINALAYAPAGKQLASAAVDGVLVWNLVSGVSSLLPGSAEQAIHSLVYSPDGKHLLGVGEAGTVKVWDVAERKQLKAFVAGDVTLRTAVYLPTGFAVAGDDGVIRLWTGSALEPRELRNHRGSVHALAATADGQMLISGGSEKEIRVWSLAEGQTLHKFTGHQHSVQALAMLQGGRQVVSGSIDGTVRLWQLPLVSP